MTCLLIVFGFIIAFRALYSCCYCRFRGHVFGRSSLAAIAQSIKASSGGRRDPDHPHSPYSSNYDWSIRWCLLLDHLCRCQCYCCKSIASSAALASMPSAHDVSAHYFIVRHWENWTWIANLVAAVGRICRRRCYYVVICKPQNRAFFFALRQGEGRNPRMTMWSCFWPAYLHQRRWSSR